MRLGVQLPEVEREVRWPEYAAMAHAAEDCGFDSLWVGDHLLYRGDGRPERGPWDCWTLLAGLAAVTSRIELGPLVACTAFRPPGTLARVAAAVDDIAGGRLRLGLGSGWNRAEFEAFGLPFDHRVSRFEEAFEIVRRLLAGERVTYRGAYYEVQDAVVLPPPLHAPPLMVGGIGPRLLAATLPHVGAWNVWWSSIRNRADGFEKLSSQVDEACETAGRPPEEVRRSACVLVAVGGGSDERPVSPGAPALAESELDSELRAFADAGADEAILVLDPISEESIRTVAALLKLGS